MQNKKYQIFVSSTYEDLKEERKAIIENISSMGHLPVGMELFVASDEEQFEYIKRVIDNCDYYILLLGGRYGTVSSVTNKSYTEMEYDYALSKGIPVLVFIYQNIENLSAKKRDKDLTNIKAFIEKASKNRMCKFWKQKDSLTLDVMNSLYKNFEEKPQRGWIRPDEFNNTELLVELNTLRKKNEELNKKIKRYEKQIIHPIDNLADMDELFEIHFSYKIYYEYDRRNGSLYVSWNDIFSYIAPHLMCPISVTGFKLKINKDFIEKFSNKHYYEANVNSDDIQTIKIQLLAYGLIEDETAETTKGGLAEFINLSSKGLKYLKEIKTIKTTK